MSHWSNDYRFPFKDKGRDRGGVDCYGLVRLALIEVAGVPADQMPMYADISVREIERIAALMNGGAAGEIPWIDIPLSQAREFDVLVMKQHGTRDTGHCGVMTGPRHVFHIEKGCEAVNVPIKDFSIAPRIVACRRHRALA